MALVKRSPQYRRIHNRLLSIYPADQWQDEAFGFVLYELCPDTSQRGAGTVGALALFVMQTPPPKVVTVKLLMPDINGSEMVVEDLTVGGYLRFPMVQASKAE